MFHCDGKKAYVLLHQLFVTAQQIV